MNFWLNKMFDTRKKFLRTFSTSDAIRWFLLFNILTPCRASYPGVHMLLRIGIVVGISISFYWNSNLCTLIARILYFLLSIYFFLNFLVCFLFFFQAALYLVLHTVYVEFVIVAHNARRDFVRSFVLAECCWLFMCLYFHIAINRFTHYVIRLRRSFYSIAIALIIILSYSSLSPFLGRWDEFFFLLSLFAFIFPLLLLITGSKSLMFFYRTLAFFWCIVRTVCARLRDCKTPRLMGLLRLKRLLAAEILILNLKCIRK